MRINAEKYRCVPIKETQKKITMKMNQSSGEGFSFGEIGIVADEPVRRVRANASMSLRSSSRTGFVSTLERAR